MSRLAAVLLTWVVAIQSSVTHGGHSRHPYCDGGQSMDGRYVVLPKLVEEIAAGKKQAASFHWEYTWTDRQENRQITGRLEGMRSGLNAVFEPVHAHIFVAPDGQTFAVWNPQVMAPTEPSQQRPPSDTASEEFRSWAGFSHRLTIYRNTGEIVKRFDLRDFLRDEDWSWLYCYGRQVYWQLEYPGLTRSNVPRVGYALYRISPDYTVLEVTIGANAEASRHANQQDTFPPPPRVVSINLKSGVVLDANQSTLLRDSIPSRPFVGAVENNARSNMANFVPNLDPVKNEGSYNDAID